MSLPHCPLDYLRAYHRLSLIHHLHLSVCSGGSTEMNSLAPGKGIKQWSQWDRAGLMDSPLPLPHLCFSCAKVFIESWWRQPCMMPIHSNGLEKKRIFHAPAELAQNNLKGMCWISVFFNVKNGANVCLMLSFLPATASTKRISVWMVWLHKVEFLSQWSESECWNPAVYGRCQNKG